MTRQAVPRYFIHVHIGDKVERDPIGLELSEVKDAIAEAQRAKIEIMTEDDLDQLRLQIMDQTGQVIAKVGWLGAVAICKERGRQRLAPQTRYEPGHQKHLTKQLRGDGRSSRAES
jgi:hypothetical protein